jgi:hypothetical protein
MSIGRLRHQMQKAMRYPLNKLLKVMMSQQ